MKELRGMVDEMSKWQVQFEKDPKKLARINYFTLQFFQPASEKCINRAKYLEENFIEMCKSCEKLEVASWVFIKAKNLLQIEMKDGIAS